MAVNGEIIKRPPNSARFTDYSGSKFGRLTVIEHVGFRNNISVYKCRCDCGTVDNFRLHLRNQRKGLSCGCSRREKAVKHGLSDSKIYRIWCSKRSQMIPSWRDNVEKFVNYMGLPPKWRQYLGRENETRPYGPGNAYWCSSHSMQLTHNGESRPLREWAEILGISRQQMHNRYKSYISGKKTLEEIFTSRYTRKATA